MFRMSALSRVRSRYVIAVAVALPLVLGLVVVGYWRWSTGRGSALAALSDSEKAWLADKDALRIAGRSDAPPFAFTDDDGEYLGYEVDVAHSLGPVLGVGVEVIPMSAEEALVAVDNGQIDAVMGMVQDAQTSREYGFSEPYVSSSLAIFVRSESLDVTSLEDLRGRQVAVQVATAAEKLLTAQEGAASVVLVQSAEEGLELLVDGQVSAFVADELVGSRTVQVMQVGQEVKVVGLPTGTVSYSFAVPKGADAQIGVLNHALAAIKEVGLKEQVDRAWFGAPLGTREATGGSSKITIALGIVVAGLVVGNVTYLLLKMRRRTGEYTASLEESRDKYQKLIESTDEAVFSIAGDGSFLEINSRVERLTGYAKDELLTMSLNDLVLSSQRAAVRDCVERALEGGIGTLDDVALLNRRGDELPVQLSARAVSRGERRIVQCMARDVRERKRMRHQVLRRSQDLSAINAIANMVSQVVDLEEVLDKVLAKVLELTRSESGIVYLSRDGGGEMIPVVKQGLTAELRSELDWPQGPRRLADQVVERGEVVVSTGFAQVGVPGRSGTQHTSRGTQAGVPLTSKDRVHGVMNIYGREPRTFTEEDVALLTAIGSQIGVAIENAQLVHQLQRTVGDMTAVRRFNENILQDMTNGLVVVDREGKIRLVNRAGERLLGCKEDEVVGSGVEGVLGFGAEIVRSSLERALAYSGEEIVVRREGGESIPLGMSVSPLRGDGDKVNGVVVMLSDLREAKAMEEERRRLDRLAFLGEISAVMAHEIRNPLAGMAAGIQHMLTKFEEGDEKHEAMERILKEGERVNRIIEDILLISRPPHLKLAPCEISEVMEEVIGDWEERARGQGVEISKYYASGVPLVKGDKMRLHQAFSNLVSNGIEAMAEGGRLSVAVTGPTEGVDGRYVEVEIRDTGVGIQEEELDNIFEPFYTTKARGTGLGLAITRRIISEHGGEVEVESEEGVGTRFMVRLPLARSGAS